MTDLDPLACRTTQGRAKDAAGGLHSSALAGLAVNRLNPTRPAHVEAPPASLPLIGCAPLGSASPVDVLIHVSKQVRPVDSEVARGDRQSRVALGQRLSETRRRPRGALTNPLLPVN